MRCGTALGTVLVEMGDDDAAARWAIQSLEVCRRPLPDVWNPTIRVADTNDDGFDDVIAGSGLGVSGADVFLGGADGLTAARCVSFP
jgi:hypothetical protein